MKNKVIVFCNNDLDSSGCIINLEYFLPDNEKIIIRTNNRQLDKDIEKLINIMNNETNYTLFICDVNFNRYLNKFGELLSKSNKTIAIGNYNIKKTNIVIINNNKSCTLNIFELFQNKLSTNTPKDLLMFNKLVDIYSTLDTNNPYFETALGLNNYFWENNKENDLENYIIQNRFTLPNNISSKFKVYKTESEKLYQELIKNNMLLKSNNIAICLNDKYVDYILDKEFKNDTNIMIVGNSYGAVRVYYNKEFNIEKSQKLRIFNTSTSGKDVFYGNEDSFTIYNKKSNLNNVITELKRISNIIISILKENNE